MKKNSLRYVFVALAALGGIVAVSSSPTADVAVASDGGSPRPPHIGK